MPKGKKEPNYADNYKTSPVKVHKRKDDVMNDINKKKKKAPSDEAVESADDRHFTFAQKGEKEEAKLEDLRDQRVNDFFEDLQKERGTIHDALPTGKPRGLSKVLQIIEFFENENDLTSELPQFPNPSNESSQPTGGDPSITRDQFNDIISQSRQLLKELQELEEEQEKANQRELGDLENNDLGDPYIISKEQTLKQYQSLKQNIISNVHRLSSKCSSNEELQSKIRNVVEQNLEEDSALSHLEGANEGKRPNSSNGE